MVRTWTGLVWVRSSLRSPSGPGCRKKVSCISRAGCFGGKLRAVKLWKSSSMSGPSATAKPISAKMAIISSMTCMVGWTQPLRRGGAGQGQVHAAGGEARLQGGGLQFGLAARRSGRRPCRSRRPLIGGPCVAALVGAHGAQGLEQRRDGPGLAERGHAHRLERRQVGGRGDLGGKFGFEVRSGRSWVWLSSGCVVWDRRSAKSPPACRGRRAC